MTEEKPPAHEYSVALRFECEHLEPSEISARLNLPSDNFLSREQIRGMKRKRFPYWTYQGAGEPGFQSHWGDFADGLQFLLKLLDSRKAQIIALSQQFDAVWWCGHFQSAFDGGPTLSAQLLGEISSYAIPLYLDNYLDSEYAHTFKQWWNSRRQ